MVYNIQAIRCFGMILVLLYHGQDLLHQYFGSPVTMPAAAHGLIDTFFVISGFIMFHTTRSGKRTPYEFWSDRIIRIYPIYWIATAAMVLLYLGGLHIAHLTKIDPDDILKSVALFPDYRGDGRRAMIVEQGWTLVYEMYFYALFGLLMFLRSQVRALLIMVALFFAGAIVLRLTENLPMPLEYYLRPITLEFAAGGVLALLYRQELPVSKRTGAVIGAALVVVGFGLMWYGGETYGWAIWQNFEIRLVALGGPAVLVVSGLLMLEKADVRWTSKTVLFFGAASYAIYLYHMFGLDFTMRAFKAVWPDASGLQLPIIYWTSSLVALALGAAVHVWIENPITEYLKRKLRPSRVKEPSVTPAP
jgi:exopolysaccharide production protein ExoZ